MPYMQGVVEELNDAGRLESVQQRSPEEWDEVFGGEPLARTVVEVIEAVVGHACDPGLGEYIEAWPPALGQALLAAFHDAVRSQQRVSVIWAPGYDFEVRMWQAPGGETPGGETPGGLIIEFRGPYPSDVEGYTAAT